MRQYCVNTWTLLATHLSNILLSNSTMLNEDNLISEQDVSNLDNKTIYVEVKGAVINPDVYEMPENSILKDIITTAGGFTSSAYTNNLNLSKKLQDQMVIYVYSKYEYSLLNKSETSNSDNYTPCVCEKVDISSCMNTGQSVIEQSESSSSVSNSSSASDIPLTSSNLEETNGLININTASLSELTTLSGIGEAKANSIIAYRQEHGYFTNIEDIKNVSGISDSIYAKIKDYITI